MSPQQRWEESLASIPELEEIRVEIPHLRCFRPKFAGGWASVQDESKPTLLACPGFRKDREVYYSFSNEYYAYFLCLYE